MKRANYTKEIPIHEISENLKSLLNKVKGVSILERNPYWRYFYTQNEKNPDPHKDFHFQAGGLQLVQNIKTIRKLLCIDSSK